MTHKRLKRIIEGISFGRFKPNISIEATTKVTPAGEAPAILISIDAFDAMSDDEEVIHLCECYVAPDFTGDNADERLAVWIKERCQDVLLHEMDEFFRFRGKMLTRPAHPVTADVYDEVRRRSIRR